MTELMGVASRHSKTLTMIKNFQKLVCVNCKNKCSIQEIDDNMRVSETFKNTVYWKCDKIEEVE